MPACQCVHSGTTTVASNGPDQRGQLPVGGRLVSRLFVTAPCGGRNWLRDATDPNEGPPAPQFSRGVHVFHRPENVRKRVLEWKHFPVPIFRLAITGDARTVWIARRTSCSGHFLQGHQSSGLQFDISSVSCNRGTTQNWSFSRF